MARICLLLVVSGLVAFASAEIISDLISPMGDERRSLDIKSQQFWELIKSAAQETHILEHLAVYKEVEVALAAMPAENAHIHGLMTEALMRLRRADEKVLQQSVQSSDLATERLTTGPASESMFSFMTGGQNWMALAVRRFIGGADYTDQVSAQVSGRQGDILPTLRGAASVTGNILDDCRMASKLSFDVLKYDIYNKGVPKTPEAAKAAAHKLVDAAGQTRHQFMQGIIGIANALTKDTEEKHMNPSAKVTQTLFSDMNDLKPFGAKSADDGTSMTMPDSGLFVDDGESTTISHEQEALVIDL